MNLVSIIARFLSLLLKSGKPNDTVSIPDAKPAPEAIRFDQFPEPDIPKTVFHPLMQDGLSFFFTGKIPYAKAGTLRQATVNNVFDFAYEMAFSEKHRSARSGGDIRRKNGEVFANTFQGKIAECAACNFFYKFDESVAPDFETYDRGRWDSVDLAVCGKQIAVKSTKHYGQLLLLETKDWDAQGRYIPNIGHDVCTYDYLLLVRINPSCEDLLRRQRLLYCDQVDRDMLYRICCAVQWEYDYAGYITHNELIQLIQEDFILPKHSLLSGKTRMDAENYYVQAIDLHSMESVKEYFE